MKPIDPNEALWRFKNLNFDFTLAALKRAVSLLSSFDAGDGANCFLYAQLGALALRQAGYDAEAVVGATAWRVGPAPGDCITHAPMRGTKQFVNADSAFAAKALHVALHGWVLAEDAIVDFTTWQLPLKARQLDAADGNHTNCVWAPPYLCAEVVSVSDDIGAAIQAEQAGAVAYQEAPLPLQRLILANAGSVVRAPTVRELRAALERAEQEVQIASRDAPVHKSEREQELALAN